MKKKFSLFLSHEEAKRVCDKTQYNEASFWDKIKLTIHLIHCKESREYTKNNNKLTKLMKEVKPEAMQSNEKQSLEDMFKKELSNHN